MEVKSDCRFENSLFIPFINILNSAPPIFTLSIYGNNKGSNTPITTAIREVAISGVRGKSVTRILQCLNACKVICAIKYSSVVPEKSPTSPFDTIEVQFCKYRLICNLFIRLNV